MGMSMAVAMGVVVVVLLDRLAHLLLAYWPLPERLLI
jgi:hypothetical protein